MTYQPSTELPSVSIFDYWSPATAIQRLLQNPLAMAVLEGRFSEGDHIIVDRDPRGELTFRKTNEPALAGR